MEYGNPVKLDYARQLAAALGYLALARLDAVGAGALAPRTAPLPLLRGKNQAARLFTYLDGLGPRVGGGQREPAPLLESIRAYRRGATRGVVMLLTDGFFPDEHAAGLGEPTCRPAFEPVFLHLLSPQELAPDMAGDLELVDLETGEPSARQPDAGHVHRYRERLDQWCGELERYCAARRIPYVRLSTALPLEEAVLGELRRRGLLE